MIVVTHKSTTELRRAVGLPLAFTEINPPNGKSEYKQNINNLIVTKLNKNGRIAWQLKVNLVQGVLIKVSKV